MMLVLIFLFNFVVQPKKALRQMPSYWSRSLKIIVSLSVVRYLKVTDNQRLDQFYYTKLC